MVYVPEMVKGYPQAPRSKKLNATSCIKSSKYIHTHIYIYIYTELKDMHVETKP